MNEQTAAIFDEAFLDRLERLALAGRGLATRRGGGLRRSRRLGDGLEFADHRDYTPGDDVRFIDWPYFARMEKLLLRLFHEHSQSEVAILVDTSASMAPGGEPAKLHHALRVAAALSYAGIAGLDRVRVWPFAAGLVGPAIDAGRSADGLPGVLDALAALPAGGRTDPSRAADDLLASPPAPGIVLIVTDAADCLEGLDAALARLAAAQAEATLLHVVSPDDRHPPAVGAGLELTDAETGQTMDIAVTPALRDAYLRAWTERREQIERVCLARQAVYVPAGTDTPIERLLGATLREAGVVQR